MLIFIPLLALALPAAGADTHQAMRRTPVVAAVEKSHGCVVNISTEQVVTVRRGFGAPGADPLERSFDDFFRPMLERRKVVAPLGSGSIITPDGLVITNEHVIRRATTIKLSLDTGEQFDAELLAADPNEDLALLRAKSDKPFKAIPMGTSSDLMLGETLVAVGNPFGFENSVTSGILSAINREIEIGEGSDRIRYTGLLQTSALINPGNSGGPLINVLGELIGINSAVVDQAQGIGFAIPIDRARDVLGPLLATPQVSEAWLGIRGTTVEGRKGTRVTHIEKGSPAEGILHVEDVITEIDDRPSGDLFSLLLAIVQHKPKDKVSLRLLRGGKAAEVTVALGHMPQPSPDEILREKLGVTGQNVTAAQARRMGVEGALQLTSVVPNGPADAAGLARGDIILQIGSQPVRGPRDAAAALRTAVTGERVLVVVVRQNYRAFARVTIGK